MKVTKKAILWIDDEVDCLAFEVEEIKDVLEVDVFVVPTISDAIEFLATNTVQGIISDLQLMSENPLLGANMTESVDFICALKSGAIGATLNKYYLKNLPVLISSGFRCEATMEKLKSWRQEIQFESKPADLDLLIAWIKKYT